jgi:flagellar motor switch protein FliN
MTKAAAPALAPALGDYVQLWADGLSQVMEQVKGPAIACAVRAEKPSDLSSVSGSAPASPAESDLWAVVTASGGLCGEMTLRLTAATALRLAQDFVSEPVSATMTEPMSESPTPGGLTGEQKNVVGEFLRQVAAVVVTAAKARWGEIQLRVEVGAAAPSWPTAASFWVQAGEDGPAGIVLEFSLSASFVAELRAEKNVPATPGESSGSVPAAEMGALGLLMDVRLTMTMRFGSRQLRLREVLELSPGAVVELDRKVQEPVDLLLEGRLVARGEVVVIDGSYGLRVTDVSPLSSLGEAKNEQNAEGDTTGGVSSATAGGAA